MSRPIDLNTQEGRNKYALSDNEKAMKTTSKIETVKFEDLEFKNNELKECLKMILQNDMQLLVYVGEHSSKKKSYAHIVDGLNIGYVQCGEFGGGVRFSTVHKSERGSGFGTGFGLYDQFESEYNPTMEDVKKSFILAPHWAKGNLSRIRKYKGLEDYLSVPTNNILKKAFVTL